MDSVIENIRKLHEERERIVDTIVKERMIERKTHKATVNSQQRVKVLVDVSIGFLPKISLLTLALINSPHNNL